MQDIQSSFSADSRSIAQMIDISVVQAYHSERDVHELARVALAHDFVAAHVLPNRVPLLRDLIDSKGRTYVGAPVGFPSGGHLTETKVGEAVALRRAGADELDMMINLGRLRSGDLQFVRDEISAIVDAAYPLPIKVILEIAYLRDDEILKATDLAVASGAAFVKTSTGWATPAATHEKVRLIAEHVGQTIKIKASGGIRTLADLHSLAALGVKRFGINMKTAVELVEQSRDHDAAAKGIENGVD